MRVDIGLVAAVLESYPLNVTNHCDLTRGGSARQYYYTKVALHYRLSNYVTVVYIIYACTYKCVGSLRWW